MSTPTSSFERDLANLLRARFAYLYISTWEEARLIDLIMSLAENESLIRTPRRVFEWTSIEGITEHGKPVEKETQSAIGALTFIQGFSDPAIFILKDFHIYFGANNRPFDIHVIRKLRDLVVNIKQSENPKNVVFVSPVLVLPVDIEKEITVVEFNLPVFAEIMDVLNDMISRNEETGRITICVTDEEKERLAKAALGLTLHEAENAFARAMVADGRLGIEDLGLILEEKRQIIRKSGILEFISTDLQINDVGGLQNLKRWLMKRNRSWLDSAQHYNLPPPRGVLLTGVPGCGKSLLAKAVAGMWQVPLLKLDMGRIFAGIVGSSEENMRRAIQLAEAVSPCVLWIDELEKGFGGVSGPSGDSGTATRVFASFLTWMQEKQKAVFVVATANNISALPPEMMRKGRFDEIFFIDLPTYLERKEILRVHLTRRLTHPDVVGEFRIDEPTLDHLANLTEGFVGAELEHVVISGLFEAFHQERSVNAGDFLFAIETTVPLSVTQAEEIRSLRMWANVRAVAATVDEDRQTYETGSENGVKTPRGSNKPDVELLRHRGGRPVDF